MLNKMRRLMFLATAVALFAVAGMFVRPLNRQQIRYDLTSEPVKGVGPGMVLATTALGAFRGVLVDVIWIRMENLKQEGKFFEIVQLADLACRLAPRFPSVWDFNAWNMAYNVSVQIPEYSERWPWVRAGIELLRDEGIPNNPNEPELYFSLAWIYMHKIGDQLDDAHFWYKQELGMQMHEVLGGGGSREVLGRFAEAPRTRRDFLQDKEVREFYDRLVDHGFDPIRKKDGVPGFFQYLRRPESIPPKAREIWEAEKNAEVVQKIKDFVRARYLREKLRLDPKLMIDLMDQFGPLDWRSPFPHAMYWATLGKRVAENYRDRVAQRLIRQGKDPAKIDWSSDYPQYEYGDIDYDRVIYGALQKLVSNGRLLYDSEGRVMPLFGPDYRFTDPMIKYYEKMLEKYGEEGRYSSGVTSAYENFLKRATVEFYYMGDKKDSQRYYEKLREEFSTEKYPASYEKFIQKEMVSYVEGAGPSQARNLIRGLLMRSYMNLGADAAERADALHRRAKRIAKLWNAKSGSANETRMSQLVDFKKIRRSVLLDIFRKKIGMPPRIFEGLKQRLPDKTVEILEKAAEEEKKVKQLQPFKVPEKFQKAED